MLNISHLTFAHPHCAVLNDYSARLVPGVTLVRGGDGRGKSTVLRLLAGELVADSGHLQLLDLPGHSGKSPPNRVVSGVFLHEQPESYRRQVFWQDPNTTAHDGLTGLAYFQAVQRDYPGWDTALLEQAIDGLALGPHLHKNLFMLSTGSKRKVWLAAAIASHARLTLLDMPFAALDKASIRFVLEVLADAAHQPTRVWVLADYEAPVETPLTTLIDLGD